MVHIQRLTRWTLRCRRSLAFALTAGTFGLAAACGDASGPNVSKTPDGTYVIATVNGKALPVAIFNEADFKLEVTSGSLVLTTDGKYSTITTTRQTLPDNVSLFVDSTGGSWVLSGSQVQFTDAQDGSKTTAAWGNGQLTFSDTDGTTTTTLVYAKKS
jgi:hypothetical protein